MRHSAPAFADRLAATMRLNAPEDDSEEPDGSEPIGPALLRRRPAMSASQIYPEKKRRPFIKRIERYFSAIVKLGRTYGASKETRKSLLALNARMEAVHDDFALVQEDFHSWSEGLAAAQRETREQGERHAASLEEHAEAISSLPQMQQSIDALDNPMNRIEASLTARIEALRQDMAEMLALQRSAPPGDPNAPAQSLRKDISELTAQLGGLAQSKASLSQAYGDLTRRLDSLAAHPASPETRPVADAGLDALLDSFYARLEDRYRGARADIANRLEKYIPDAQAAVERTGKPVLDLGCGRGEWLEQLRKAGLDARGVDLNDMQLREARALNLDVRNADAIEFLASQPDASFGMVTAHHLVEHMPFRSLAKMTREATRVLAPGGVLLYETPNVRNVVVGASSFHVDPTHQKPMPAEVLTTLMETLGFHPIETRFLHPHPKYDELVGEHRLDPEIAGLLFGPQDLAVLGVKTAAPD